MAKPTLRQRFDANVDRSGGPDVCWPWTASTTTKDPPGYGQIHHNGKRQLAHRLAYEFHTGEKIPDGLRVLHRCDHQPCCNPSHLFLGTQQANMIDMHSKGRHLAKPTRGTTSGMAKLTDDDVIAIRDAHAAGATQMDLARRYGLRQSTIYSIVHRKTWRHI